ncbi:MAG: M20/M25/M40 family metallo-hydrolase [Syntrophothermus sp.]
MRKIYGFFLLSMLLTGPLPGQRNKDTFDEKYLIDKARNERRLQPPSERTHVSDQLSFTDIPDSVIKGIISEINPDSIRSFIQELQDFKDRSWSSPGSDKAALWIRDKYTAMGFSTVNVDSFLLVSPSFYTKNITAVLPGKRMNEYVLIGAHYDSRGRTGQAPGADDNASGVSASLEIARVLKKKNYFPECTILFAAFGAEETGLDGSFEYVQQCQKKGLNIKLMINADMISYTSRSLDSSKVTINYYAGAEAWLDRAKAAVLKYTKLFPVQGDRNANYSDSFMFYGFGYQAVYFEENELSPWYHKPADTVGNYNMPYCAEIIKAACALLLQASTVPPPVTLLTLDNVGDGESFKAVWGSVNSPDFSRYKVYIGASEGIYDTTIISSDTSLTVKWKKSTQVYFAVSAVTIKGEESSLLEKYVFISTIPPVPEVSIKDIDKNMFSISIVAYGKALMFSGFNIYRSDSADGTYTKLNPEPFAGQVYSDLKMKPGRYYYYKVKSAYSNGVEGAYSNAVRGRLISMDKGLGMIITTDQIPGVTPDPSAAQIAQFYSSTLKEFKYTGEELFGGGTFISLSELGAYSTVFWCNNTKYSNSILKNSQPWIKKYLDMGGRILIATFNPSDAFPKNNLGQDSVEFNSGDFIYDYFKVKAKQYSFSSWVSFSGALSKLLGYPDLQVDASKSPVKNSGLLDRVERIYPSPSGKAIYSYNSNSFDNPLKDLPVGIEYMGSDYKTVLLSFPLYYIKESQAKDFLKYLLVSKFQEVTALKEQSPESMPSDFIMEQNYPNPFNPVTTISYSIPMVSYVELKVYDMLGREVSSLVNEQKSAGEYKVQFDGSSLPSGVYIYNIKAGRFSASKKLILIK